MAMMASTINERYKPAYNNGREYGVAPIKRDDYAIASEVSAFSSKHSLTLREAITRKINKTLCIFLLISIVITFVSYYIAMNYEAKLNNLDREIVRVNTENQELQADLDRYKSFNNVDSNVEKFNLLQKADKVIEVTAMNSANTVIMPKKNNTIKYNWAIGY